MNARRFTIFAVAAIFCALAEASHAASVNGRFSTWAYLRDDSVDHVYVVPLLAVNLYQLGHDGLSLETAFRGYSDIQNGKSATDQLRIQRAVLVYAPRMSKWEWRLGQQWLTEGVGYGHVAGLWAKHKFTSKSSLTAYAGARLPGAIDLNSKNNDEGVAGGLRFLTRIGRTTLGASYFVINRDDEMLFQGVGLEGMSEISSSVKLRARLDMNIEQSSVETGQLVLSWRACDRVDVVAEVHHDTPRLLEDSYFVRFLEEAGADYARGEARWRFCRSFYAKAGGHVLPTENDLLYKAHAALGIRELEVGYTHWVSVSEGDMDGFFGHASYRFTNWIEGFGGFDFSRGSNSIIRPNTETHSIFAGMQVDPTHAIGFSGRIEQVDSILYEDDVRGLLSVTVRFSTLR